MEPIATITACVDWCSVHVHHCMCPPVLHHTCCTHAPTTQAATTRGGKFDEQYCHDTVSMLLKTQF